MSTSRLEKFIYAICSMEVSDLPAPLSRIEILWNCLITGETPDFEPQSRNEKYLMAMLGLYELENLPTPMSRGEKLLYKIAMGETDLSDIPAYLSRYEELLGYSAENGGVGDFEYILQTLNQRLSTLYSTKERPVKSAILSGNTIKKIGLEIGTYNANLEKIEATNRLCTIESLSGYTRVNIKCKKGYQAYVRAIGLDFGWNSSINVALDSTSMNFIVIFKKDDDSMVSDNDFNNIIDNTNITELSDNNLNELVSVKMPVLTTTGKNLWNPKKMFVYENLIDGLYSMQTLDFLQIGKKYVIKAVKTDKCQDRKVWIKYSGKDVEVYNVIVDGLLTNHLANGFIYTGAEKLGIYTEGISKKDMCSILHDEYNFFIYESGTHSDVYEPYKSNILSTSEDVELRGIGDVRDELNLLTGEITERVGEVVLSDSNSIALYGVDTDTHMSFRINGLNWCSQGIKFICDKFPYSLDVGSGNKEGIYCLANYNLYIRISKNKLTSHDINGFKEWLNNNPLTIQYELATESVKTVDLTTVDQDGQPTKLKTFNDISYVEINADNIIPSVDVEVATKISETLSTLDPQQLDISNTQNELGQTIDEQTENTDAAMLATTEIYENL